jgi:hypothetical protein
MYPLCEYSLFWSVQLLPLLSLTPSLPPPYSKDFNTYCCILYLHRCNVFLHCSIILFSFPTSPEFHRVVPVWQTCSTYEFVYEHVWFCIYVYLSDLSSTYERKHAAFFFLSLAYFIQYDVLQLHPFTLKPHGFILPY